MYILAIDPGEHTGCAAIEPYNKELRNIQTFQLENPIIKTLADKQLDNELEHYAVIVCENYIIRSNTVAANIGSKLLTVQIIGALRVMAHINNQEFVLQTPAQVKSTWPDKRLSTFAEKYNLPAVYLDSPHKKDALRHLLYYIESNLEPITVDRVTLQ